MVHAVLAFVDGLVTKKRVRPIARVVNRAKPGQRVRISMDGVDGSHRVGVWRVMFVQTPHHRRSLVVSDCHNNVYVICREDTGNWIVCHYGVKIGTLVRLIDT